MKVAFSTSGVASQQDVLIRGSSRVRHAFATPKNVSVGGEIECYLSSGYFCCFFSFRREEKKENELQGGHYDRRLHWGSNWLAESGRRLLSPAGCWMKGNLQLGCEIAMFGSQEVIFSQVIFMMGRRIYWFLFIRKMGCKIRRLKSQPKTTFQNTKAFKGLDLRTTSSSFQGPLSSFEHILTWCRSTKLWLVTIALVLETLAATYSLTRLTIIQVAAYITSEGQKRFSQTNAIGFPIAGEVKFEGYRNWKRKCNASNSKMH